jgi:hypothetical protein
MLIASQGASQATYPSAAGVTPAAVHFLSASVASFSSALVIFCCDLAESCATSLQSADGGTSRSPDMRAA